ncbi:hairy/enhancer-of-split related with YRPW motif-like protein isoform X1 [Ornithodoros turicata]|uniref:hairy/enhancer-of-split related with YRPW motif-like protein isoform X1 n=1 Tax=Ornithodoros turicata TaxID=34597 RepID=UPI003139945F
MDAWEEALQQRLKMERTLNFSTLGAGGGDPDEELGFGRKKPARDPMSHRIIEKRRRDRMNNCLADLNRLLPTAYLKKGRGRIEKTEIIEMAIKHLKHLQAHACRDPGTCEVAQRIETDHQLQFRLGFQECMSEAARFLVETEGLYNGRDDVCLRLVAHLQKHFDKLAGSATCCPSEEHSMGPPEEMTPTIKAPKPEPCGGVPALLVPSPPSPLGSPPSSPTMSTEESSYKFKNTIKHRFQADQRQGAEAERRRSYSQGTIMRVPSPTRDTVSAPPPENGAEASWDTEWSRSSRDSSPSASEADHVGLAGVPAFALHPRGAYYIPLALEPTLVAPLWNSLPEGPPALHPVSISVNFGVCRRRLPSAGGASWPPMHPWPPAPHPVDHRTHNGRA